MGVEVWWVRRGIRKTVYHLIAMGFLGTENYLDMYGPLGSTTPDESSVPLSRADIYNAIKYLRK